MILHDPKNREEWLECRMNGIGGSDAGAAIGKNKYMSNVELWEIKTHRKKPPDLSGKPAVEYGKKAEEHIREIFALDHPEYDIEYHEFRMYASDENPWLYATLDGELVEKATGRKGILEIKTGIINNFIQWKDWDKLNVPDSYYVQMLHQLLATGWDFCYLRADLRSADKDVDGGWKHEIKNRIIERLEEQDQLDYLLEKEKEFWQYVIDDKRPPLILPTLTPQSITT